MISATVPTGCRPTCRPARRGGRALRARRRDGRGDRHEPAWGTAHRTGEAFESRMIWYTRAREHPRHRLARPASAPSSTSSAPGSPRWPSATARHPTPRRGRAVRGRTRAHRVRAVRSQRAAADARRPALSPQSRSADLERRRADAGERALLARGSRAMHTWRPCSMRRSESSPHSSGGTMAPRSCSIFTGSVSFVSLSRRARRVTCVSTGRPGSSNHTERTTLPVLRPTPGERHEIVELRRDLAAEVLLQRRCHPDEVLRLRAEEAGRLDQLLDLVGIGVGEVGRRRVLREQRGRDHVDALVGALRGEDRRDEQLVRVRVVQRAVRVGVQLLQAAHDCVGARLRTSGTGHGGRVPCALWREGRHAARVRGRTPDRARSTTPRAPRAVTTRSAKPSGATSSTPTRTPSASCSTTPGTRTSRAATTSRRAALGRRSGTASGRRPARCRAAIAHVEAHGGGAHRAVGVRRDRRRRRDVRGAGFEVPRDLYEMRVPLPIDETPQWPAGVTVRDVRTRPRRRRLARVNNRAFADHPEQGGWIEETLQRRMAEPLVRPVALPPRLRRRRPRRLQLVQAARGRTAGSRRWARST